MAELTFKDYLKQEKENKNSGDTDFPVKFFKAEEGVPATVRFYLSEDLHELKIHTVHKVGEFPDVRTVECIREGRDRKTCPFCSQEVGKLQKRAYIFLLNYVEDDEGNIKAVPCKWERSASARVDFLTNLQEYASELGDLKDYIFKITKSGSGLDTKYTIMPYANQGKFDESIYVKDFSAFKDYGSSKDLNIYTYTKDELNDYCDSGEWPATEENNTKVETEETVTPKRTFSAF